MTVSQRRETRLILVSSPGVSCRGVKASHVLLSAEGRVCLSGLQSVYSLMKDGKRTRAVFDMPQHSPSLLPWLSPELLRQVTVTHRPHMKDDF